MPEQTVLEPTTGAKSKTDQEIFEDEKLTSGHDPMFLVKGEFLTIKTKAGDMIRLKLNEPQKKLMAKIEEQIKLNKPVRMWILKARQEGVSTEIEGIIYAFTSQQENVNSLIMADEHEHASNLFEMSKLYHEQLEINEPHLAPTLKKSNEKKLEFEKIHSQIIIATAENIDAARSHTFKIAHLSEVSRFRDLKAVMNALNQSVAEIPGTMIFGETTANGMDEFYREWKKAIDGKTDWIPVFVPWFALAEYSMPLQNGELRSLEGINFGAESSERVFIEDEKILQEEFSLSDEQLNFRRYAIINKCGGDINTWNEEYPATWEDAFQTSGEMFFDRGGLKKQLPHTPKKVGELFFEDLEWKFRDLPYGRVKIYTEPVLNEEYVVASDAAEGLPGRDEASIVVLDKRLNETVAVVNGFYSPEELAQMSIGLGNYYNNAMVAPENKHYGYTVCQLVYQKYGNIYKRIITKKGEKEETEELGFNTNSITRPQMLALFGAEVKNNSTRLISKEVISQCQTFIVDPKTKKPQAQKGEQDGLVICSAIARVVRQQYPYVGKAFESSVEERSPARYGMGARAKRH